MFAGKTIIITGASSGLGQSLALKLAEDGADLVLFARNKERLKKTAQRCQEFKARPLIVTGDVTKSEDCAKLIDRTLGRFGSLDYLVANAGVSMWARFEEIQDISIFPKIMETNYLGVVYCTYYALPHLRKSNGMVVAISSIQGKIGVPYHTAYVASKHALQGFFASLRAELGGSKIDILIVLPHWLKGTNLRNSALGKDGRSMGKAKACHSKEAIGLEKCTEDIVKAMGKRKRELVLPTKLRILPWLNLISPRIVDFLVQGKMKREYE